MKNMKRFITLGILAAGLFAAIAPSAQADDDGWGRVALGIFLGAPVYAAPAYVAPPPPPRVEYRYYARPAPPPGYYYQQDHYWHDRRHWEHHREDDD